MALARAARALGGAIDWPDRAPDPSRGAAPLACAARSASAARGQDGMSKEAAAG
jgi:hypothetical protein